jgi:hypothetical protein
MKILSFIANIGAAISVIIAIFLTIGTNTFLNLILGISPIIIFLMYVIFITTLFLNIIILIKKKDLFKKGWIKIKLIITKNQRENKKMNRHIINESRDSNTGAWNTGIWNSGDSNAGACNAGNCNSGSRNTGDRNTGDWNAGNWNSGDWNSGNFNTHDGTMYMFNKPLPKDFDLSSIKYPDFLFFPLEKDPYKETARKAWNNATREDQEKVLKLPNFDNDIFEQIFGINVINELKK